MTSKQSPGAERPQFDYELVVCPNFDAVLRGADEGERVSSADLVLRAFDSGRVLIQAKGGSGKTTVLGRLASAALELDVTVSTLDALVWADAHEADRSNYGVPQSILAISTPPVSEVELRRSRRTLLLIDGLNEISPPLGALLLDAIDQIASQFPSIAVIVTDRLNRRRITEKLWVLATLSPVSKEQVHQLLKGNAGASEASLRLPFYLNLALDGEIGPRSEQHRIYLLKHGGVEADWLSQLTAAAYGQYALNGDRDVNLDELISAIGGAAVESLVAAGTLCLEPSCRFAHHLVHDYLAATYAAAKPTLWDSEGLDVLTFKATSMDALAMVLEQAPENADLLVRRVYDWNFYGAAYLIAEDRAGGAYVSGAMELAVVTMLGERRFDRFASTAQQVSDALQVIETSVAREMASAPSQSAIVDYVRRNGPKFSGPEWLEDWIALYTRRAGEPSTPSDVDVVASEDSVLGWTMSNVIRRSPIGVDVETGLTKLAAHAKGNVVRWRAVHALGADPTNEAVATLFNSVDDDESIWVRYGSIRSLVEIALVSEELREPVLTGLAERVSSLRRNSHLTKELERVLVPKSAPAGWADDSALLVETLWAESTSVEEQDRWRKLGASIRSRATSAQ